MVEVVSIVISVEGAPRTPPDEDGYTESVWPWLNLANVNARTVFMMVGLPCSGEDGLWGAVSGEKLSRVIRNCLRVMNSEKRRRPFERAFVDDAPGDKARMIVMPLDDEYLIDRTRRLLEVLKKAQTEGASVVWG